MALGGLSALTIPAAAWVGLVILREKSVGRVGRATVLAAAALAVGSAAATALTFDPASWGWCRCVANPFAVTSGPATHLALEPWLTGVEVAIVATLVVGVAGEVAGRPGRLGPTDAVVAGVLAVLGVAWLLRDLEQMPHLGSAALLVLLVSHLRWAARRRPSRAHVADLLLAAREESDASRLQELVARALGDPGAVVHWWDCGSSEYRDVHGGPVDSAERTPERVLAVGSEGRPIALVVGSQPLLADQAVHDSVAEALRLSSENRRLSEELQESLDQVRESRSRILVAGDEARQRIERDLHDGAQQLLISTGVKLNLASARIDPTEDPELADSLDQASSELGRALSELRQLARGITPTALVHGGLGDALEELALRSPVPTTVELEGGSDLPSDVGATVYFVVAEALTNVAKHARASGVTIRVHATDPRGRQRRGRRHWQGRSEGDADRGYEALPTASRRMEARWTWSVRRRARRSPPGCPRRPEADREPPEAVGGHCGRRPPDSGGNHPAALRRRVRHPRGR